jgi:NDP-sugar pyrophosphorylase family protein
VTQLTKFSSVNRPLQLVIPAAGLGKRFLDAGILTPKPCIEVNGIALINWVIGNFTLKESDKIIILTRKEIGIEPVVRNFWSDKLPNIEFIELDQVTDGPAETVSFALSQLNPELPLIVANSDQYVSAGLDGFVDQVRIGNSAGFILTMNAKGAKWSFVERDRLSLNSIVRVVEKVEISDEATVGIYGWAKTNFFVDSYEEMKKANDRVQGEFYVAPTYNYLVKNKMKIEAIKVGAINQSVHGLGTPEDLAQFKEWQQLDFHARLILKKIT